MFNFVKNCSIKTKMIIGTIGVILVMMFAVGIGMFELHKNGNEVEKIRKITEEEILAHQIQDALYKSRIDYEDFLINPDEKYEIGFSENVSKMEALIDKFRTNSINEVRLKYIEEIKSELSSYQIDFNKIVSLNKQHQEYFSDLSVIGAEMLNSLQNINDMSSDNNETEIMINASLAIEYLLNSRLVAFKFYVFHNEVDFTSFEKLFENLNEFSDKLGTYAKDPLYRSDYLNYESNEDTYLEGIRSLRTIFIEQDSLVALIEEQGPKITSLNELITDSVEAEKKAIVKDILSGNMLSTEIMGVISVIAVLASIIITFSILRMIIKPISVLTTKFSQISKGDIDLDFRLPVTKDDELGKMSSEFNSFMVRLKKIMTEIQYQNKLKTEQNELSVLVRDNDELSVISQAIINNICNNFNFQIGAIFLNSRDDSFRIAASYAYKNRKGFTDNISKGDGIIGQCILEKKAIIINNLPDDYITLQSGLGESVPSHLAVLPCIYENQIKCILELGSFSKIEDDQIKLLEELTDIIASALYFAEVDEKMKTLLNKTLQQSEELKMQQEELQQSNEELEEQARELMASEAKLQVQQEELKVSNEEFAQQAKALEEQKMVLDDSNEELLSSQKLMLEKAEALEISNQYKSEFLANMSHELRTPLNSILVLSQLLGERDQNKYLSDKEVEFAKTIYSSGTDLLSIINDILDLSKVEAGHLDIHEEKVNLNDLLVQNDNMFKSLAVEKGIEFMVEIADDVPDSIVSDSLRINQIIKNLVSNAIKFTEAGEVLLKIRSMNSFEKEKVPNGNGIAIEVSDTGIGISEDKHSHIFEAFKQSDGTTSRKYGGTGLGLTISKELSHLLGGDIYLESKEGKGSSFSIILPYNLKDKLYENISMKDEIKRISNTNTLTLKTKKKLHDIVENVEKYESKEVKEDEKLHILIIEDDRNFSKVLASLAEDKGYKVTIANNGAEGKSKAILLKPDAIILDIGLPDVNGLTLAKEFGRINETRNTPIHIISGEDDKNLTMPSSVIGYLQKPVDIKAIYDTLGKIEEATTKDLKQLLVVGRCGDEDFDNFKRLGNVEIERITLAKNALELLGKGDYQCVIVDVELEDMSGVDFIKEMNLITECKVPAVIYTDQDISDDKLYDIDKYATSIILKSSKSEDRLVDEVSLFLHKFESNEHIRNEVFTDVDFVGKKVLLVDDDDRNLFALTNLLENKGMTVITANDGNDCLVKLENNEKIDLVLMDVMMPNLDGYETIKIIRNLTDKKSKLPIITLTAKAMQSERLKSISAGANDYLTKPVDVDKLVSTLKVWL